MQGKKLVHWEFNSSVCKVQWPWSSKALKPMFFFKLMNSFDLVRLFCLLTYLPGFLEDVGSISVHHAGLSLNLKDMLSSLMLLLFFWRKSFNVALEVVSDTVIVLKSLLTTKGTLLWTHDSSMIRTLSWKGKDLGLNPWSKPDRAGNWTWLSSVRD